MQLKHLFHPSKKKIVFLLIAVIVGITVILLPKNNNQKPLSLVSVKRADLQSLVSSSGFLTGANVIDLKFRSGGKLSTLKVATGDQIKQGSLVASLDNAQQLIALQQANNTLRAKQATKEKVLDDVKDHDDDETFTQKQLRTDAEVAKDNAFDEVKSAQKALNDTYLYAPISGLVTQAPFVSGQTVGASDLIAQIVDSSQILFETDVDEADISKVTVGQQATVSFDAYPDETFPGSVAQIVPQIKTTSSGASVVTVNIKLDNFQKRFIQGLTGQSDIVIAESKSTLIVPIEAVREDNVVIIPSGQNYQNKKVETGIESDTDIEIRSGLSEGEQILLEPASVNNRNSRNPLQMLFGGTRRN